MSRRTRLLLTFSAAIVLIGGIVLICLRSRGPKIYVEERVIDCGVLDDQTGPKRVEWSIRNVGDSRLDLTRIRAKCACLKVELSKSSLSPGEEAVLRGTIRHVKKPGERIEKILLSSNDPEKPRIELIAKVYMKLSCMVVPEKVVLNNLRRDESRIIELEVLGGSEDLSFQVLDISSKEDSVEVVNVVDAGMVEATQKKRWKVNLSVKGKGKDYWQDTITFSASTSNGRREVEVPITVTQVRDIIIRPRVVFLRQTSESPKPSMDVEVSRADSDSALQVLSIDCPNWLVVTTDLESDRRIKLNFKVKQPEMSGNGRLNGEVALSLRGREAAIRIPVVLFGAKGTT